MDTANIKFCHTIHVPHVLNLPYASCAANTTTLYHYAMQYCKFMPSVLLIYITVCSILLACFVLSLYPCRLFTAAGFAPQELLNAAASFVLRAMLCIILVCCIMFCAKGTDLYHCMLRNDLYHCMLRTAACFALQALLSAATHFVQQALLLHVLCQEHCCFILRNAVQCCMREMLYVTACCVLLHVLYQGHCCFVSLYVHAVYCCMFCSAGTAWWCQVFFATDAATAWISMAALYITVCFVLPYLLCLISLYAVYCCMFVLRALRGSATHFVSPALLLQEHGCSLYHYNIYAVCYCMFLCCFISLYAVNCCMFCFTGTAEWCHTLCAMGIAAACFMLRAGLLFICCMFCSVGTAAACFMLRAGLFLILLYAVNCCIFCSMGTACCNSRLVYLGDWL